MKELLKTILIDQKQIGWKPDYLRRSVSDGLLEGESIVVISGIRRCGKSTLLHQFRQDAVHRDYYCNFDDERLITFNVEHFQLLHETFIELYGVQQTWYFDEVQNISGWERFVRRLHDMGHKVFVTGSNATMLSRELGTHLTGRYRQVELFPFSFAEFLQFRGIAYTPGSGFGTEERARLAQQFNDHILLGGLPVYLREGSDEFLTGLYQSILYRDVMVRNKLTSEKELMEMVYFLASNVAKTTTYGALCKVAGVKNPTTIKSYLGFLENSYLLFQVNKYDHALRKQLHNPKKIYFIDNALVRKVGFQFSEDRGRLLENLVFIELKRRGYEIFYHAGKGECDFVVRQGAHITMAIQVCDRSDDPTTQQKEHAGLLEAMNEYGLPQGLLLLRDTMPRTLHPARGLTITEMPVWQWLLG